MSFILDALKKLEQKRKKGSVPDLMTVHYAMPQEPKRRSMWPYLLLVALLINAGILTAWLHPWKSEKQNVVARLSVEHELEPTVTEPDLKDVDNNSLVSVPSPDIKKPSKAEPSVINKEALSDSNKITEESGREMAENVSQEQTIQSEADNQETASDKIVQTVDIQTSLKISPTKEELKVLRAKIKEEQTTGDDLSILEQEPAEDIEADSVKKVLERSQLPPDIRKKLPVISINGHIYSNNPSSRIVNINGSIIREGDKVSTGLTVEEITISGVVFDYRGYRFHMRAF